MGLQPFDALHRRMKPRNPIRLDIAVEAGPWPKRPALRRLAQRAVDATAASGLRALHGSELSLVFTDDAHMRGLNREWRRKDRPTNVLSFPGSPPSGGYYGPLLGDIVLAFETIGREAEELGLTFEDHLTHLIVHGMLHLFGHDHLVDSEAEVMEGRETAILAALGIADPYAGGR